MDSMGSSDRGGRVLHPGGPRVSVPHTPIELLSTTRTVRRRLDPDRPVDIELVRRALGVAVQAPTGGGVLRAHFVVVTDARLREELGELYRRCWDARYADLLAAATGSGHVPPDLASAASLAGAAGRVPVLVVACVDTEGRSMDGNQASVWGSVLPAAWSYMLAARAFGLATAWTTVLLDAEAEVAALLDLPAPVRIGAVLPTAYPIGDGFRPARRENWAVNVHEERW